MAIDPHPPTAPSTSPVAGAGVIENELPAYRAISGLAVSSLVLSLMTVFAFADLRFLAAGALAVVVGLFALRRVAAYPDILTGAGFARVGIFLAVVLALMTATTAGVGAFLRSRGASEFAARYQKALNSGEVADAVWYRLPPSQRKGVAPGEVIASLKKGRDSENFNAFAGTTESLVKDIAGPPKGQAKFSGIETSALDGTTQVAALLFEVTHPGEKGHEPEFALVEIKAEEGPRAANWFVSTVVFPYSRGTFNPNAAKEAAEKEHGHAH